MPKLRALRKPEDIAAVPADQPVAIDLSDEVAVAADTPEPEKKAPPEVKEPPPVVEPEPEPEPELEPAQEESPLRKQLEQMEQQRRADQERHAAELARERGRSEQAEYVSVVNAIGVQTERLEAARRNLRAAREGGDTDAEIEAIETMTDAKAQLRQLEEGKAAYDEQQKAQKTQPPAQPRLPKVAEDWLSAHPEYRTDAKKNKHIGKVHDIVVEDEGHVAFSPEYFESLENHLGLRRAAPAATQTTERRSPPVSAPVSRDTPSMTTGRPQRRTVELSAEQREAARISGVDDLTYAKGVLELERRKKLGMYPDR